MRDYAKVAPQFWTGRTGKSLKAAGPEAVIVAMYLMTSPHANMIGVYHCPVAYIAIDTGLTIEGATKGLQRAIEADFCTFEADTEYVFVHAFAEYQIGAGLDPKDLRCKGVARELEKVPKGQCWQGFRARYAVPFNLPTPVVIASPLKAPSKPGAGAGAGAGARKAKTSQAVAYATPPPDDVAPQVWADWLALRKAKRAPVTATVIDSARNEAGKAGLAFEAFLAIWCRRGSQGLEASWLKPNERQAGSSETAWQRSQRELVERASGGMLSKTRTHQGALNVAAVEVG